MIPSLAINDLAITPRTKLMFATSPADGTSGHFALNNSRPPPNVNHEVEFQGCLNPSLKAP